MKFECDFIECVCEMFLEGKYVFEEDFKVIDKEIKVIVNESVEFLKISFLFVESELWMDIVV